MEMLIKDYKAKDNSSKRKEKRQLQLKILNLFRDKGQKYRLIIREGMSEERKQASVGLDAESGGVCHKIGSACCTHVYPQFTTSIRHARNIFIC